MSNKYPDITAAERQKLVAMGWLYNPKAGVWMLAPNDKPASPHQADHDRWFPEYLLKARVAVEADKIIPDTGTIADTLQEEDRRFGQPHYGHGREADTLNNATSGDTGLTDEQKAATHAEHDFDYQEAQTIGSADYLTD